MNDAAQFFQSYYILWLVGMLDPDMTAELDELSPPGVENWRQVMHRECQIDERKLQARFLCLCESMSDDDAVETILLEFTGAYAAR